MRDSQDAKRLDLPFDRERLRQLRAGELVLLNGEIYTMRDAGHMRALKHLREHAELPFGLAGSTLFYAGPTPAASGRPFGSIGPTTSSRMDFATPEMMRAGIAATIGKGKRSLDVVDACIDTGGVYFAAVGGIAAKLAKCVKSSELVGWEDLGTEALRRITVEDLPVYVGIDSDGRDLYRTIEDNG